MPDIPARIEALIEKKLVGKKALMSFAQNKTFELWKSFMPRRKEVKDMLGANLYSVEVYDAEFFNPFRPKTEFEKWAAVEVNSFRDIPVGMEKMIVPAGLYAVFLHRGPASEGPETYQYIFENWLPQSEYLIDHRPHFAVMGEKYKRNAPESEEEILIPVRHK